MKAAFFLYLTLLPASFAGFLQDFFPVDGVVNNSGEFVISTVQTLPLSSVVDFITVQDGGLQETFNVPLKLAFPAAPVQSKNVFSSVGIIIGASHGSGSLQLVTEPVQIDCGGSPCPFTPAIFAPELVLPPVEVIGVDPFGPDLHGKLFDVTLRVNLPVAVHAMNPGFNAKSSMIFSGPNSYDFSIVTTTTWDDDPIPNPQAIPEPAAGVLAGLGLICLGLIRSHGIRGIRPSR